MTETNKKEQKYTITAVVTKITSEGRVRLNGVGKHRYEKSKDEVLNFLECDESVENSKLLGLDNSYVIKDKDEITRILLAMAMLNKKPLKLTIESSDLKEYSIAEVEVP